MLKAVEIFADGYVNGLETLTADEILTALSIRTSLCQCLFKDIGTAAHQVK
jgi:hypothetical protein